MTSGPSQHNDNHVVIPAAFARRGWNVFVRPHDSLAYRAGAVWADDAALDHFDLVWPIGFGNRATFLDRAQLLLRLPPTKLVTRVEAWLTLHGKAAFLDAGPAAAVAAEPEPLLRLMEDAGGDWVLKPCAGSFGRNVHFVPGGPAGRKLLKHTLAANPGVYFVLQRYLPEVISGETRTLVADGRVLGSYLRIPTRDIRANVALGAGIARTSLTEAQRELVLALAGELRASGVGFAAIDTVGAALIEVNIANPGGLSTLASLYEHDFAADAVARLSARLSH